MCQGLSIWGDSIAKGVVFDETRGRYMISKENCVMRLNRELGIPVDNHAVMGCTSEQGRTRMDEQQLTPGNLAIIEFGGNDCDLDWAAASEQPNVRQTGKVSLERFADNLVAMVRKARENGMVPVLVTPPPLVAQRYFQWVTKNLDPKRILNYLGDIEHIYRWQERYAVVISKIARSENTKLLDVRDIFLAQDEFTDLMCADGIHPNEKGHALLYENLCGLLQGV